MRALTPAERVRARRIALATELREDLEMCGVNCSAVEAAKRCGVQRCIALRVLVPLHREHGYPVWLSAQILGVTDRTVWRYRALDADGWTCVRGADGRWLSIRQSPNGSGR